MTGAPEQMRLRRTTLTTLLIFLPIFGLLSAGMLGLFLGFISASLLFWVVRQVTPLGNLQDKDRYALKGILTEIKAASEAGDHKKVADLVKKADKIISGEI